MMAVAKTGASAHETRSMYLFLKYLHIFCVAASFSLFFVRGLWIMRVYPPASEPWIKALPHVVDSLLLLSAVGMVATAPRFDWNTPMQVKLGLIVIYIGLAVLVFRAGTPSLAKAFAWVGGLLLFLYVTTVALVQHPLGVFSLF
jgi:uncharacterized membrane protein SirB2